MSRQCVWHSFLIRLSVKVYGVLAQGGVGRERSTDDGFGSSVDARCADVHVEAAAEAGGVPGGGGIRMRQKNRVSLRVVAAVLRGGQVFDSPGDESTIGGQRVGIAGGDAGLRSGFGRMVVVIVAMIGRRRTRCDYVGRSHGYSHVVTRGGGRTGGGGGSGGEGGAGCLDGGGRWIVHVVVVVDVVIAGHFDYAALSNKIMKFYVEVSVDGDVVAIVVAIVVDLVLVDGRRHRSSAVVVTSTASRHCQMYSTP